tara:strand:- start:830 stop:1129 length:300 start_codon:yes stop_codon:yes gene_type:complete
MKEELKRDYWSDTLDCITGKVKIDRREIAAVVICKPEYRRATNGTPDWVYSKTLDIHLKSGSIFTVTEWDADTVANLSLTHSPHEEVHIVPNNKQESVE